MFYKSIFGINIYKNRLWNVDYTARKTLLLKQFLSLTVLANYLANYLMQTYLQLWFQISLQFAELFFTLFFI